MQRSTLYDFWPEALSFGTLGVSKQRSRTRELLQWLNHRLSGHERIEALVGPGIFLRIIQWSTRAAILFRSRKVLWCVEPRERLANLATKSRASKQETVDLAGLNQASYGSAFGEIECSRSHLKLSGRSLLQ
jgi:hypothetical protein